MIILDEHFGQAVRSGLSWYPGKVIPLQAEYPGIQDDNIVPLVLHKYKDCAFVTANVRHFWGRVEINRNFCVVCFNLESKDFNHVPRILKLLFRTDSFYNKSLRNGHVFRVNIDEKVDYYTWSVRRPHSFQL